MIKMGIQIIKIASGAADASGDSTKTTPEPVNGIIRAIELVFGSSSSSGMDTYITEEGSTTDQAILAVIGSATSAWFYPYNYAMDTAGNDLEYASGYEIAVPFYVARPLTLVQDDQTEGKAVTAYIYVEKR